MSDDAQEALNAFRSHAAVINSARAWFSNGPPSGWEIRSMNARQQVKERVFLSEDTEFLPGNLAKAVEWLAKLRDSIPEKYRHKARIEFETRTEWDSAIMEVEVYYMRLETNEEFASRKADIQRRLDLAKNAERAEYERLKAVFEASNPT